MRLHSDGVNLLVDKLKTSYSVRFRVLHIKHWYGRVLFAGKERLIKSKMELENGPFKNSLPVEEGMLESASGAHSFSRIVNEKLHHQIQRFPAQRKVVRVWYLSFRENRKVHVKF